MTIDPRLLTQLADSQRALSALGPDPRLLKSLGRQAEMLAKIERSVVPAPALHVLNSIGPDLSRTLDHLVAQRSSLIEAANVFSEAINSISPQLEIAERLSEAFRSSWIDSLPRLTEIARTIDTLDAQKAALGTAGLGDLVGPLPAYLMSGIENVHPRVQTATLTNRLLGYTRRREFFEVIQARFATSAVLSARWGAVEEALDAHSNRRYLLSIPALLPLVEGVVGDALVLKEAVKPYKGTLYVLGPDGKRRKHRDGSFVKIRGAQDLASAARKVNNEALDTAADALATFFLGERNPILHGRKPRYGKPKLSLQSLLALYFLAEAISDFEQGDQAAP